MPENEHPVVHLIGGPPGAGKTTLGIALAARLGRSSMTIDDLRTSLLAVLPASELPELRVIGRPDAATYFTNTPPDVLVDHGVAQHTALWPAIEAVIRKRVTFGIPAVLDGWHLLPDLVTDAGFVRTCAVWIDVDPDVLEQRERAVWDFYETSDDPQLMFDNFLERSVRWTEHIRATAERVGAHLLRQDGTQSVEDLVEEVIALGST